ncbi:MAG: hypothetical protein KI785_14410, partial [Devosiaceae bacterium]|nr:hypothetical protein [Devosiaceae bacterium MH13]
MQDPSEPDIPASGLSIGDSADGVTIEGSSPIEGLPSAYLARDAANSEQVLAILVDGPELPPALPHAPSVLTASRIVRFGGGTAMVVPWDEAARGGQTFSHWVAQAGALPASVLAARLSGIVEALHAHHRKGAAHGHLTGSHLISDRAGTVHLLPGAAIAGSVAQAAREAAVAPEGLSGDGRRPTADIYSLGTL